MPNIYFIKCHQCMLVHVIKTSSKCALDTEIHENKALFMDAVYSVS